MLPAAPTPAEAARTVEIRPPSARAETWAVARALFHVAYWSALVLGAEAHAARPPGGALALAAPASSPFERRFQDLSPADQRTFRSLQEGIVEAERLRASTGRWPSVATLARAGVPPFAPDPLDRARYAWESVQTGLKADYLGVPAADSGREGFFVVFVEPEPGTPDDPLAREDEVHHRLPGGPMIHVTVWLGPPSPARARRSRSSPSSRGIARSSSRRERGARPRPS